MSVRIIRIGDTHFQMVATIEEGFTLHFLAGRTIAVEKMDMRPGGTEFDFQVNSRAVHNGRGEDIAAMRDSRRDEFLESRVKTNFRGLPISVGNGVAIARGGEPELTYGEITPQTFTSRVTTDPVGWTIRFIRAHYAGGSTKRGPRPPRGDAARIPSARARAWGNGSASADAASDGPRPGEADGRVGLPTTEAVLRLYVPVPDLRRYRRTPIPFGTHDMIFDSPSIFQRLRERIGW